MNFAKQKRAIVGLEAAIILIAFVIIASVFSFMVLNQGLFATEQGKTVIQEGLQQASTPLAVDGTVYVKTSADGANVTGILIPLKTYGVKYVSVDPNSTAVTLKVGGTAWANVYNGSASTALGDNFTGMLSSTLSNQALLFIQNSNGDKALDAAEKGYLLVSLSAANGANPRTGVSVEIRLEKTAPLTIQFTIPESMPKDSWLSVY